jgi:photosystem II stability/assembly factor-like uncharacterized protein
MFGQCAVEAGAAQSIICGGSAQLGAESAWVKLTSGSTRVFNSTYFIDENTGFAVGESGTIMKTSNGGTTWTSKTSGTTEMLESVFFVSSSVGFIAGGNWGKYIVLKTINAGESWSTIYEGNGLSFKSVYFTSPDTGYTAGGDDLNFEYIVQKTTNGGTSWTTVLTNPGASFRSIFFPCNDTGYVAGYLGKLFRTTNAGLTWQEQNSKVRSQLTSLYFTDNNTGYAVCATNDTIIKTTNGGNTWTVQRLGSNVYGLYSVHFTNKNTGYIAGNILGTSVIYKTGDAGTSWSYQPSSTNAYLVFSLFFPNEATGYGVGSNGKMCKILIADSVVWMPSTGLSDINNYNPLAQPITTTTYTINAYNSNGCVTKDSVKITVDPLWVWAGQDKSKVCGATIQMDQPSTNYSGLDLLSYSWHPSTGLDDTTISRPTAYITENETYALTVLTSNGCYAYDTVHITVNPLTVNTGSDKSIICGGNVLFDAPVTNYTGSGTLTYDWMPENGLDDSTLARPTAEIISDQTYTLSVSTPNGCLAVDSVVVSVQPLAATASDVVVSCGSTMQLNVSTNYTGSGALSYTWTPDTGLSATDIYNPLVSVYSDTTYFVEVQTPNGCIAIDSAVAYSVVTTFDTSICMVTVGDNSYNVVIWRSGDDPSVDTFLVYRESLIQTNLYELIGKVPGDSTGEFIDTNSNARVQSNRYKISVKDVCGFETLRSGEHKTMHLTINQGVGNIWNLIWEPYEGQEVTTYRIYRGDSPETLSEIGASPGSNTTYTDLTAPEGNVYYQIAVYMPQSCAETKSTDYSSTRSNIIYTAGTGIDLGSKNRLTIFPNPVSEILFLKGFQPFGCNVMIYDLQGKLVLKQLLNEPVIDVSDLTNGIYTIQLILPEQVLTNKFVKD